MTTSSKPAADRSPREVADAYFAADARGDVEAVRRLFAPDATFTIPGDPLLVPWVGTRDRDGIGDYMREIARNATVRGFEAGPVLVQGEHVVVLGRFALTFPGGGSLDDPFVIHMVVRDGLIRSWRIHEDSLNLAREVTGANAAGTLP